MTIFNIHPVDELAAIREEIHLLEAREKHLRNQLVEGTDEDRDGKQYRAYVQINNRETLDKNALIAAFSLEVIAPFIKKSQVKILKTAKKDI